LFLAASLLYERRAKLRQDATFCGDGRVSGCAAELALIRRIFSALLVRLSVSPPSGIARPQEAVGDE
jgi:hypothetical protein